jgi:DNA polymerase-3 subunit alpha
MCIASGTTLSNNTFRHTTDRLYVLSPEEMRAYFSDVPEAVDNPLRISELCNVELRLGKTLLPDFQVPEGHNADSFMQALAHQGLKRRFEQLPKVDQEAYTERLNLELRVICSMGFSGYFLIVQDFINWAKRRGIPVGPGRGSGAGSLVAFALGITDLDPIPYHLLFERFLNPERVSMPDFDIDFCQYRRDEVIQYVSKKYGENNVGQIITFGSLKAKSVLRDVCRVYGLPYSDGDRLAKLVPGLLNITLKQAIYGDASKGISGEARLKEMMESPTMLKNTEGVEVVSTQEVLEVGMALEGLHRHAGMHAAGIVISDKNLWEYVPVCRPSGETALVTQFAKDEVEAAGLVKFDFLGLKTLTVVDQALKLANQNRPNEKPLTTEDIPLDDAKVFELISSGDTAGIFQMESSGFTDMVTKLKPNCFEDVIAAGALYRPGPLDAGMVDTFINRKHGREKVSYPHPSLESVLKETHGVIVYQEQVMQISQVLGGYSLGRADLLRRAMGKKKVDVMAKEREGFLEGCLKKGVDAKVAGEIFDMMETFAEYGFNKSHSAAYGLITVQTAWLKTHYPLEFTAALLTSEKDNTDKVVSYIAKARATGREVLPPDVNHSLEAFSVVDGKIRFGLGAIKGVGAAAIEAIVEVRDKGPFLSLLDFCARVDGRRVNKRVVEALVKAGAFDFEKKPRRQLFESIAFAMERGAKEQRDLELGQGSLFDDLNALTLPRRMPEEAGLEATEEWTEKVKLGFEKEAIGFYVSGHPLQQYEREIELFATPTSQLAFARKDEKVAVAGIVASLRERPTRSGKRMAWVRVEDLQGSVEAVCFPGKSAGGGEQDKNGRWGKSSGRPGYEDWEMLLKSDEALLFKGSVQWDESDEEAPVPELLVEDVKALREVQADRLNRLELNVDADMLQEEKLLDLKQLIEGNPGKTPLRLRVCVDGEVEVFIRPAKDTLAVNEDFLERVKCLFGPRAVNWN